MSLNDLDRQRLREALALAEGSIGLSEPNPRVGCVIGLADGTVLGQGYTQQIGGPHAEVMALRDAMRQGLSVRGATVWVTLEPCAHHGRTPPCCDALVEAGLARVVVATPDPFPAVAGAGIKRLRAAKIEVALADKPLAQAARELNIGFSSRHERGRPWLRLKMAASLDGITALADGRSQWITGEAARADGHTWRRRAGAVLTGIGTVLADDPRLDVRLVPTRVQPMRVVLDPRWRMPPGARVLQPPGRVRVYGAHPWPGITDHSAADTDPGTIERICQPGIDGRIDLAAVLRDLHSLSVNELHVEAGATLNGAWLASGLVDELLVYMAPRLIGPGRPLASLPPLDGLQAGNRWQWIDSTLVGDDLRLRLRQQVSARFTDPDHRLAGSQSQGPVTQ